MIAEEVIATPEKGPQPRKACGAPSPHTISAKSNMADLSYVHVRRCSRCGLLSISNSSTDQRLSDAYVEVDRDKRFTDSAGVDAAAKRHAYPPRWYVYILRGLGLLPNRMVCLAERLSGLSGGCVA